MNKYYLRAKHRKNDRQRRTKLFRVIAAHMSDGEDPVTFLRGVLKASKRPGRRYAKGFRGQVLVQVAHARARILNLRTKPCPA